MRPLAGAQSFLELLGRVKATVQGALAHADIPFQQIVSDLNVPRNAAYSPVFQTMFALENSVADPEDAGADKAEHIEVRIGMMLFFNFYRTSHRSFFLQNGVVCMLASLPSACRQEIQTSHMISLSCVLKFRPGASARSST